MKGSLCGKVISVSFSTAFGVVIVGGLSQTMPEDSEKIVLCWCNVTTQAGRTILVMARHRQSWLRVKYMHCVKNLHKVSLCLLKCNLKNATKQKVNDFIAFRE